MEIATPAAPVLVVCKKHYMPFCVFVAKGKNRRSDEEILDALKICNDTLGNQPCCIDCHKSNSHVKHLASM